MDVGDLVKFVGWQKYGPACSDFIHVGIIIRVYPCNTVLIGNSTQYDVLWSTGVIGMHLYDETLELMNKGDVS